MKKLILLFMASSFLFSCAGEKVKLSCEEKINETKEEKKEREYFCKNPTKKGYYRIEL